MDKQPDREEEREEEVTHEHSHTIYSPRFRGAPPKPPTRLELLDEVDECVEELNEQTDDGFLIVGRIVMLLAVVAACSIAYWCITHIA